MTITFCDFFWGSHGCELPPGHEQQMHQCHIDNSDGTRDFCSQYDPYALVLPVRFYHHGIDSWGTWMEWTPGFSLYDPEPVQMNC